MSKDASEDTAGDTSGETVEEASWETISNSPPNSPDIYFKNSYKLEGIVDIQNDHTTARCHLNVACRTNADHLEVGFDKNNKMVFNLESSTSGQGARGDSRMAITAISSLPSYSGRRKAGQRSSNATSGAIMSALPTSIGAIRRIRPNVATVAPSTIPSSQGTIGGSAIAPVTAPSLMATLPTILPSPLPPLLKIPALLAPAHTEIELERFGYHHSMSGTITHYTRSDYREYDSGWQETRSQNLNTSFLTPISLPDQITLGSAGTYFEAADYKIVKKRKLN